MQLFLWCLLGLVVAALKTLSWNSCSYPEEEPGAVLDESLTVCH
jgi:hypothetical protein